MLAILITPQDLPQVCPWPRRCSQTHPTPPWRSWLGVCGPWDTWEDTKELWGPDQLWGKGGLKRGPERGLCVEF